MKDFTAIKHLLSVMEEEANRLEEQKKWISEYLQEEETRKNNLYKDDDGNYHSKNKDGNDEELNRWEVERIDMNIKEYISKIKAYDTLLDMLASIDLNKVTRK